MIFTVSEKEPERCSVLQYCKSRLTGFSAFADPDYELDTPVGVRRDAINRFAGNSRLMNRGGRAEMRMKPDRNLLSFGRGWSNGARPGCFCGRTLYRERFAETAGTSGASGPAFSPVYSTGEVA